MPTQDPPPPHHRRRRRRRRSRRPPVTSTRSSTESESDEEIAERECGEGGLDLESGELERKVHENKRECRICQLVDETERGDCVIELGCCCKEDLGAAHKQCAETWFKIKGNMICEICGATVLNVVGEQTNNSNATVAAASATSAPPTIVTLVETQSFWHGRRLMNILLGCMVFAFIVSWVFHFNLLPHHQ